MAAKRTSADELAGFLAGSDRPIRMSLYTRARGAVVDSVDTTVDALRYPSAPITFNPCADGVVLTWTVFPDDPEEDEDD